MNSFGGNWTDQKMDIVVSYAKAYLTIMKKQKWAKTIYFDGFAGSGSIAEDEEESMIITTKLFDEKESLISLNLAGKEQTRKGTALRILDIVEPTPFNLYYFVEKNDSHYKELNNLVKVNYAGRNAHVVKDDCNDKLISMANFLSMNRNYTALAFIDPYGMSVNWASIEALKGHRVDLWILVPTGVGANRLLKRNGEIPEKWLNKLEVFLGLSRSQIIEQFYKQVRNNSLFGSDSEILIEKEKDTIKKLGELYSKRLKEIFAFVSKPFVLRNSVNSVMYHFFMATNNKTALRIADEVIKPKYKM